MCEDLKNYLENGFEEDVIKALHLKTSDKTLDDFELGYQNSNFQAWNRCYDTFKFINEDYHDNNYKTKKLCFALIDYLEAWGMYSRNAILKNKPEYTVHSEAVSSICSEKNSIQKYSILRGVSISEWDIDKIRDLYDNIETSYRNTTDKSTETLVTKVMLGTLACVPALDDNVNTVLRHYHKGENFQHTVNKISALINICKKTNIFEFDIPKKTKSNGTA